MTQLPLAFQSGMHSPPLANPARGGMQEEDWQDWQDWQELLQPSSDIQVRGCPASKPIVLQTNDKDKRLERQSE